MSRLKLILTIVNLWVDAILAAHSRWGHRKGSSFEDGIGGHYWRRVRAARARAFKALRMWGYTVSVAGMLVRDAHDIALLEIGAEQ